MVFQAAKVWMESGPAYLCGCGTRSSSQRGHLFRCDTDVYRESQTASPKIHRKMWNFVTEWERNQVCRAPSKLLSKWWRRRAQFLKMLQSCRFRAFGITVCNAGERWQLLSSFLGELHGWNPCIASFCKLQGPDACWVVLAQPIDVRMSSGPPLVLSVLICSFARHCLLTIEYLVLGVSVGMFIVFVVFVVLLTICRL